MDGLVIDVEDPRREDVRALLDHHLTFALEVTPLENAHALDLAGLLAPDITFVSARRDGTLLGVGALRELEPDHGEIKSMHTAAAARGQGVGRVILDHLVDLARARGYRRVSLETGTMDVFAPARALYTAVGFLPCEPFGGYPPSPHNAFMSLRLV